MITKIVCAQWFEFYFVDNFQCCNLVDIFFFNPVFFSLPYRNHGYVPIPFLYLNLVTVLRQIQTIGNFGGELYGRDQAYLLLIVLRQFTE